jgi:predicted methyltransferase
MKAPSHSFRPLRQAFFAAVWFCAFSLMLFVSASPLTIAAGAAEEDPSKPAVAPAPAKPDEKGKKSEKPPAKKPDREPSVTGVMNLLGLGEGAAVADIGAGNGEDTWVFAKLVGSTGTVFAEELGDGKVKSLAKEGERRGLPQVRAVLGRVDDPCLPPGAADLAFMRQVYHHVTKPREMLRGIWRGLKPGGHLVVIDRHLGTLRDWVPRDVRGEKHYWLAETTVVREAREEGFLFIGCAEKQAHISDAFVLVFQRPKDGTDPGRDPDLFLPLPLEPTSQALRPERPFQRPVFISLGESRGLIPLILKHASGPGLEIVLEEWATQKDERPPLPDGLSFPSVLTEKGDPHLGPEMVDAVFFFDSYHLLFHGPMLLPKLHERLAPDGRIYVLDREAKEPLSRREASHRRRIEPAVVKHEMVAAGFVFQRELFGPAADRFLLVFGKNKP